MAILPVLLAGIVEGAIGAFVGAYTVTRLAPQVAINPSRRQKRRKIHKAKRRK